MLHVLGCDAEFVTDPAEALAAAQRMHPHIVFLDIAMPGMNGYEVAALLRANFDEQLKIVAVTGFAGSEHRAASRRAGFDAHVRKPVEPDLVRSILETLLSTS